MGSYCEYCLELVTALRVTLPWSFNANSGWNRVGAKSPGLGARLPRFKTRLYHLLIM